MVYSPLPGLVIGLNERYVYEVSMHDACYAHNYSGIEERNDG